MWSLQWLILGVALATVSGHSEIFLDETWESGHIGVGQEKKLFYWLFETRDKNSNAPLILWLQGGPGCSGVTSVLAENGPYRLRESLELEYNPYSWNNKANVLYVDQPLGAGFSGYKDESQIPKNMKDATEDLQAFLKEFVNQHPKFRGKELYIAGQAYGSRFVVELTRKLLFLQIDYLRPKGVAIGNGWYDPITQVLSYPQFDWDHQLTSFVSYYGSRTAYQLSALSARLGWYKSAKLFLDFGDGISAGIFPRYNLFDIRRPCTDPQYCYNVTQRIAKFMQRPEVLKELGVSGLHWSVCNPAVLNAMVSQDYFEDLNAGMEMVLNVNKLLKVAMYTGDQDRMCNFDGILEYMGQQKWNKKQEFDAAPWQYWYVSGSVAGKYKKASNLTFYQVYEAGQMVAYDQPERAYDIITDLISPQNY